MPVIYVNPENHMAPAGQYSHVAIANEGRLAFIAGQVALDAKGSVVGDGDAGAQFAQVFDNLAQLISEIGSRVSNIVDLKTYLVGEDSIGPFREARYEVFRRHFGDGPFPPNTLLVVSGLASPELLVEVSATVSVPD
jgi:enamine deaminase RidA (YjgF/YER057c/UK114 family)